jgi:hypothetical protein
MVEERWKCVVLMSTRLHKAETHSGGVGRSITTIIYIVVLVIGLFMLGPELYTAVEAIIADYSGAVRPAFSCAILAFL